MAIPKNLLEGMNNLLSKGKTISEIAAKYPGYDYSEIYWSVNDYSILGKKRMITNRLKNIVNESSKIKRKEIAGEAQQMLNELYSLLKSNSSKLLEIDRILRKLQKVNS
jgi:hypothetical protein